MRRNRRHRVGSRCGSVTSHRCVATSTGWAMVTAAKRRHLVAMSPATVIETEGFIVSRPNTPSVVVPVSATREEATGQQDRQRAEHKGER
ncbi:MAG: hypothetical protein ABSF79_04225 [Smithellaceae bacterium]